MPQIPAWYKQVFTYKTANENILVQSSKVTHNANTMTSHHMSRHDSAVLTIVVDELSEQIETLHKRANILQTVSNVFSWFN